MTVFDGRLLSPTPAATSYGSLTPTARIPKGRSYEISQATLTTPVSMAALPDAAEDHAVDAGSVAWAFALPQPSVTHTLAAGTLAPRLFVADNTGDQLFEIDPNGADTEGTILRTFPATLSSPSSMTVLNGRLLVADNTGDELWEIDPDGSNTEGTLLRDFPGGLSSPTGMTAYNGRLLVADDTGNELWEIDPNGADTEGTLLRDFPTGLGSPSGMTVFDGRLFVADDGGDELWEIDPDGADTEGTLLRDFPSGLSGPRGMTVYAGRLFVSDIFGTADGDELFEIDPDGADTEGTLLRNFPNTLTSPVAMAVLGNATDHAVDAGAVAFAFHLPQPTVTHTALVTTDHAVDAGNVSWAFALPQPTVTHTPAVGPLLALSDFDDTGLDVETAALLEASAPGTSGNNFYRDSTRGGSDTPIEGELGVGPGETRISRMRRASTANLTLNDNNQPVGLAFDAFFGTGGAGADLTLYLQTTSAGLVSFTVAGAFLSAGGNWLNVTLPTAARTLLNNLATGDRFIFALARAATVAVDHAVDAGSIAFAFALPQPTVTHTLAAVTTDHAVDAGSVSFSFALPQPSVTHTLAVGTTGQQTIQLQAAWYGVNNKRWTPPPGSRPAIDAGLRGADPRFLHEIVLRTGGIVDFRLASSQTQASASDQDLTSEFEQNGSLELIVGANSLLVSLASADTAEPYIWFPANSAEVVAFAALLSDVAGSESGQLIIRDFTPPLGPVDHAVNAGAVEWAFALPQPSVTHTRAAGTVDHAVNAGSVEWAFHLPQPTVTHSLPARATIWAQYAITINTSPVTRFWTGRGRLDYQGDLYEGGGRAVGVGEIELVSGNPDRRLTITLSSIPPSVRAEFLQDVGAVEVEVSLIFSADRGSTWRAAPLSYSGRLSSPTMVNGRLTVELETLTRRRGPR